MSSRTTGVEISGSRQRPLVGDENLCTHIFMPLGVSSSASGNRRCDNRCSVCGGAGARCQAAARKDTHSRRYAACSLGVRAALSRRLRAAGRCY